MWERFVTELTQATQEIVRSIAQFLPRLMVMLIIVLCGWIVAYLLKAIIRSILRLAKFDRLSQDAGASQFLSKAALPSSTELLSRFVFWVAWIGFILIGISVLGIGEHTTLVAFAIVFGALMLGLALAFGLGGRDLARRYLERRFVHERHEEKEDELSPL